MARERKADPWDDPRAQEWRRRANRELLPMIKGSAMSAAIWPVSGEPDAKLAVELGFGLLLDKPLVFLVPYGQTVPSRLARAADKIIYFDPAPGGIQDATVELNAWVQENLP